MEDTDGDRFFRHKSTLKTCWFRPGEEVESVVCSQTGDKFFVNLLTGESAWDDPRAVPEGAGGEEGGAGRAALEDAWVRHTDRDGDLFFVNELTRATSWDLPPGAREKVTGAAAGAAAKPAAAAGGGALGSKAGGKALGGGGAAGGALGAKPAEKPALGSRFGSSAGGSVGGPSKWAKPGAPTAGKK